MIKLALKNIKSSITAYKNIYALLFVSQFVGILILLFVYGIITNYNIKLHEKHTLTQYVYVNFDEPVSAYSVKEIMPEMLEKMEERLECCFFDLNFQDMDLRVTCIEDYENGKYFFPKESFPEERLAAGRYPTEEELMKGKTVAFAYGEKEKSDEPTVGVGDKCNVNGKEYEIVGVIDGIYEVDRITIPLNSCTEDMKLSTLAVMFDKFPTVDDYDVFVRTIKTHYGDNGQISDLEIIELDDIVQYNSVILLAFMIGGIAAFDTILVYRYLLKKRQRQMAIFSVEGATKIQRIMICIIEIVLITMVTTLLGIVLFDLVLKNPLLKVYKPSMKMYTLKVYLYMALCYFATIILGTSVMVTIGTRKRVLDIRSR